MMKLKFGQPVSGIVQFAYIVPDIHQAMESYSSLLQAGPWFHAPNYELSDALYCGTPSTMTMSVAIGFAGHMSIELIQQTNDAPSVYRDVQQRQGYGFHHWGLATLDFDHDVQRYLAKGYELKFSGRSPRGIRLAYFDSNGELPGMIELIEFSRPQEDFYNAIFEAGQGQEPKSTVHLL